MKKIVFLMLLSLGLSVTAFGQGVSDEQLLQYALSQKKAGMSEADIASGLMQRGATLEQIQRMRTNNEPNDNANTTLESLSPSGKRVFGRDIFNNGALTFEPQMNIATPQNYVLGPGDQLIIDVYGDTQKSEQLTVSPDGDVTVPGYGPIHVSGLSVASAQSRISKKLRTHYASSEVKVSVGQTRSIMVNVMGEVRTPGTYTISAFATVFHALYRAGGINSLGTLRNIKVFRQGRQITSVDVYEFILNGRLAGNVRLQENDVIQVGPYESIVEISGHVKRPMAYELRKNESLATLLKYCGGFSGNAYRKTLRVLRNTGQMRSIYNVDEFDWSGFHMEDGDQASVEGTYDRYENMVEVKGAVFRPGMYQLSDQVCTVRSLIERAEGLTEEAMTAKAVMRRMKPNRTQEVISLNLERILNGTEADVPLQNEDVIFIPTMAEHQTLRTLTITGEVIFPGTYEYADNMTIEDFILQAGGLTDRASNMKIDVSRRLRDPNATGAGMEIAKTFSFTLNERTDFTLEPYDIVQIRRSPVFQDPIQVRVEGEIAFEGGYTMELKNQRLSDVVKAAGGVLPGAYVRGARLVRTMSEDERARLHEAIALARQTAASTSKDSLALEMMATQTTYLVGIHLDEALANPGCDEDIELRNGDRLIIPRFNHTVKVSGDILKPNTVAFKEGKGYKYYVEQGGGYGKRARKSHTYILYQNGTIAKASKAKIEPGCEVIVPTKGPSNSMALQQWMAVSTSFASLATMFISIANMIKK